MPIRITGMNSGLDTESIISELVKAQETKVDSVKKKQTALSWKQDAWKELNSKVYKLFNSTLNSMRFATDYSKKTTSVSNSSVASVITNGSAMNATQKLKVISLATSGYMTGDKLTGTDAYTDSSSLTAMGITAGSKITVNVGTESTDIEITDGMTIGTFVGKLQSAGVEASFDKTQQRFYIASKESGAAGNFTLTSSDANGADALSKLGLVETATNKVTGKDAEIVLNGVTYTGSSNTFEINGLTITALSESTEDVMLSTRQDTEGIYDMIKNFLKEYNTLINEMDKLYNADSSKGYEPLTEDEKGEMTDSEIEKWEKKIKDSILRRDSNLSTVSSSMKNVMLSGITVGGQTMYLSNFGVETLSYFTAPENEKNALHINGDEDDDSTKSKDNTLMEAIASDPDSVISFFSQLSQKLYTELDGQMASSDYRSFGSIYDDKKMQTEYNNYTTKIKEQEAKLKAMEDKWYDKFSAMETALARLQSNQSAVSSLLGGA